MKPVTSPDGVTYNPSTYRKNGKPVYLFLASNENEDDTWCFHLSPTVPMTITYVEDPEAKDDQRVPDWLSSALTGTGFTFNIPEEFKS